MSVFSTRSSRRRASYAALASIALIGGAVGVPAAQAEPRPGDTGWGPTAIGVTERGTQAERKVGKVAKSVKVGKVIKHLEAFQDIADEYGDRAAGRPGYAATTRYITQQLRKAGYQPTVQRFDFTYVEENNALERTDPATSYEDGSDFNRNTFDTGSPMGTATGPLTPVGLVIDPTLPANSNTSGCEVEDFADFPEGGVALVQRGTCGFAVKVLNAQDAGAAAVIVMNEGQPGRTGLVGMIGDATGLEVPAVFATSETGTDLAATPGAEVTVTVDYLAEERSTSNVFAETKAKKSNKSKKSKKSKKGGVKDTRVVMAGAHLDSVQDGAGINDNGTGSAALLETAIRMKKAKPDTAVRFAWWGAEEEGLLGAEHYVSELTETEIADILLYLNFDMIGSPNYTFGVYDGDNSGGTAPEGFIPPGSAQIEDVFEEFYSDQGEPFVDTDFSGRSDYGPFIAVGVPSGGLFTGAEGVKTAEEAATFGGVAGAAYDPCYHDACDNLTGAGSDRLLYRQLRRDYQLVGNVNVHALSVNSKALAHAVASLAADSSDVTGATSERARASAARAAVVTRDGVRR